MFLKTALVFVLAISLGDAYRSFRLNIPNGERVPHPCKPNYIWEGVGHKNTGGGGARNIFGIDFNKNGKKWDETLCRADSDNDGKTNGEELGDPDCKWKEGAVPERTGNLSHPGVCEPWDSPKCLKQNNPQWEFCSSDEFQCDPLNKTDDVRTLNITYPRTKVPAVETSYFCMTFELPTDGDYHMVATTPIIDNKDVMHHMLLYGCTDEQALLARQQKTPTACGMASYCQLLISKWTLGNAGQCAPAEAGYRIGKYGFKTVVLQVHWNNPEFKDTFYDSSGMTLHYTPNLRKNDAGTILMGQTYLEIPPGQASHIEMGKMSEKCSKGFMSRPIQIYDTFLHMHYLGKSVKLDHIRKGTKIRSLGEDEVYEYDNPQNTRFKPPITFLPGDEAEITCEYDSTSRKQTTYYGEATNAEMCYVFIEYYPANENLTSVTYWKKQDQCAARTIRLDQIGIVNGCDVTTYITNEFNGDTKKLTRSCDIERGTCRESCKPLVRYLKEQTCLGNAAALETVKEWAMQYPGIEAMWVGLDSCNAEIEKDRQEEERSKNSSTAVSISFSLVTLGAMLAVTSLH